MNKANFQATLDLVKRKAEKGLWNQSIYGNWVGYLPEPQQAEAAERQCGSPHCFIGWAAHLAWKAGFPVIRTMSGIRLEQIYNYAARWLEITDEQERWIAQSDHDLPDFQRFLDADGIPDEPNKAYYDEG